MNNPFRGFGAILFKEFIVVTRDRAALFFMFFPPLVQIIAFGFALDNDVRHMATVVYNEDRTRESRELIDRFVNTQSFAVVKQVNSLQELSETIRRGKAYVGLDIPPDFARKLRAGQTATVQMLVDGSNSTIALQALNTGMGITLSRSVEILLQQAGRTTVPVEIRPQMLYNPAMRSPNFFVPGVIGIALQIAWFDAPDLRAPKAIAAQVQVRALETLPCIPLGQLFQPTAFRSDIRDIVKAAFPLFWGVRRA